MRHYFAALVFSILSVAPLAAQQTVPVPSSTRLLDVWDVAYLQGNRAGYVHTSARQVDEKGQRTIRASVELRLTVKRFADTLQLAMDTGDIEAPDGKVLAVSMRQGTDKNKQAEVTGIVEGDKLKLTDKGKTLESPPWDDRVVGLLRQQTLYQDRRPKPGEEFTYLSYEPTINIVVETTVRAKDYEEVDVLGSKQKKKLLRIEAKPERIDNVQLPTMVTWVDSEYHPIRSETEVPGLGKMVLFRTTKDFAMAPATQATLTDIGINQYVRLRQSIIRPYDTAQAVYRLTIRDDDDPVTAFATDSRQEIKLLKGNAIELIARASQPPPAQGENGPVDAEFLESSYYITASDTQVKYLARQAVGIEKEPWRKGLRIEKWVHDHMKATNLEALATADRVARTLSGDCTEYAMLTAAMCRAEGIPSRTAIGLIYADVKNGPVFAFHMWTEVCVRGQWCSLDATLGLGKIDAVHLKIADQSWHNMQALTPLLPVVRVLGKVNIDVVRYQ